MVATFGREASGDQVHPHEQGTAQRSLLLGVPSIVFPPVEFDLGVGQSPEELGLTLVPVQAPRRVERAVCLKHGDQNFHTQARMPHLRVLMFVSAEKHGGDNVR
jgi:hypothetical protein